MSQPRGGTARGVVIAACSVVAALGVRGFAGAPVVVGTGSMAPALVEGEVVWVDRSGAEAATPGALVAWRPDGARVAVKRVVATAGQVVELSAGALLVDGAPVRTAGGGEPWGCSEPVAVTAGPDHPPTTVPPGHVFLLGDDRRARGDSRQWGPVPAEMLVGRARWSILRAPGAPRSLGCNGAASGER